MQYIFVLKQLVTLSCGSAQASVTKIKENNKRRATKISELKLLEFTENSHFGTEKTGKSLRGSREGRA